MFGTKTGKSQKRIDCLIGAGTTVEGNITFPGGLRVDGNVRGNIAAVEGEPATLVLSEQARVEGEIRADHVVINGSVTGSVHADEYVELQAKARVKGDVHYRMLEIQLGAVVEGSLVHRGDPKTEKVVQFKPASAE